MENKFLNEKNEILNQYDWTGYFDLSKVRQKGFFKDSYLKCRFCGKDRNQTTFRNESHTFPRFIGNKFVLSEFECDLCNEKFSRTLENDFANFMKLLHNIYSVKGRKGIPTYKRDGIRLENKNGFDFILEGVEDSSVSQKGFSSKLKSDDFIPIAVYKSLVKMALSMVSESELSKFSKTFEWLQDESHSNKMYHFENLPLFFSQNKNDGQEFDLSVLLFKRKTDNSNIPCYMFKLLYNLFAFQIYIPFCSDDLNNYFEPLDSFKIIPNKFEIENNEESYRYLMDCSSNLKSTISVDLNVVNLDYEEN
ncbi:HNH endonuclease [Chryseobacterium sp. TY3]